MREAVNYSFSFCLSLGAAYTCIDGMLHFINPEWCLPIQSWLGAIAGNNYQGGDMKGRRNLVPSSPLVVNVIPHCILCND
jgi:hypothetical protein